MSNKIDSITFELENNPINVEKIFSYKGVKSALYYLILSIGAIGRKLIISDGERQFKYFIPRANIPSPLKKYGWFWFSSIVIDKSIKETETPFSRP